MPTTTTRATPRSITIPNDLDHSLLDSSPPEGTELRETTSLVSSIVRSSNFETPVMRYIERSEVAFERTYSEISILRKENAKYRKLLRVRKFVHAEGRSWSGRLKYILNCDSVAIIHDLEWAAWYYHLLAPSGPEKNHIPVRRDHSDLERSGCGRQYCQALPGSIPHTSCGSLLLATTNLSLERGLVYARRLA